MDSKNYINALRQILEKNMNSTDAAFSKKYLRNQFEFYGIMAPARKVLFRNFLKEHGSPSPGDTIVICRELYDQPQREFHYFAMELAYRNIKKLNQEGIKLFEYMIVTHAWWDTVDYIAVNLVGRFFTMFPELINSVSSKWMDSGNIWLQRSCILFQLKYKRQTDLKLLYSFIEKLKNSKEFFIQKAIGWFLREYSKINPDEVIRFVGAVELKPLSRREALRIMKKKGIISDSV